ncbi:MAG: GAF domain-containing protein [Bacteroidetes bacterium]|jgi:signal transduction histidine kinase|nr:GAF domain-containing protein [Bacteroidota bacterium]
MTADSSTPFGGNPRDHTNGQDAPPNIVFASAGNQLPDKLGTEPVVDGLDPAPEHAFDRIAELAAHLFQTPAAFISLINDDYLWFKAAIGIDGRVCPLETSFCSHAFAARDTLVVEDATEDERFADNPLVTATPGIRFYAGAPLITDDGQIIGSICVLDSKPHEAPVSDVKMQHLVDLAQVVMDELELRRELKRGEQRERELREARNNAESAKEAMSQFFAGITHDLRTPLTQILLFNDLLERVLDQPNASAADTDYTTKIRTAGTRMNMLITSLLELAELRSGRFELELEPVNVLEVVTEACEGIEILSESDIDRLSMKLPDAPLFARADTSALTRVLDNLIGNAIKHTDPDDRVQVCLRLPESRAGDTDAPEPIDASGDGVSDADDVALVPNLRSLPARGPGAPDSSSETTHIDVPSVIIEIADNGPGIPSDLIDTLFDPYTRGPKRSSSDDEGSSSGVGLGLAITSDLVHAMDGAIHVHTKEGLGTCFHIHLPAVLED